MNDLAAAQKDALKEICNVGMSKAAKQLSTLLNSPVEISIPEINLFDVDDMPYESMFALDAPLAYVYQELSEDLHGRAILIFQREHTSTLTQAVIGKAPKMTEKEVRACEKEAMVEIGNVIISSFMSAIVNMLSCHVKLSVPSYNEDHIVQLTKQQLHEIEASKKDVILIVTKLAASGQDISGNLLLMLDSKSVQALLQHLDTLLGS